MLFSIIIINYKQKELLTACIKSIRDTFMSEYEIIVVNNSPEADLIEYENIIVINNSNLGFSQANNLASKKAKGKYLFFLNADTVMLKDMSIPFLNLFKDKEFGAAGIGLRFPDGRYQLSYWYESNFLNEFKNKRLEKSFKTNNQKVINKYVNKDQLKEVDWVSGAAIIINKDAYESISGFDEDYFLFYEDADICKRLKDNHHKIYYFPFDGLVHYKGENVNKSFSQETYYYSKKSQLIYYKKHNNIAERIMLRIYLIVKSSVNLILHKSEVNLKIFKLVTGVSND